MKWFNLVGTSCCLQRWATWWSTCCSQGLNWFSRQMRKNSSMKLQVSLNSHINIVRLLGFCFTRKKRALVYEFMSKTSLDKLIYSRLECLLPGLDKLYMIALGVAGGLLEALSTCTQVATWRSCILTSNLNILLDEDFVPKIADFGLAKLLKKKQNNISLLVTRGTIGYIAPEVFSRNFGLVSHKSDVYRYGMMLLEMVGAKGRAKTESIIQSSENYFH